MMYNKNNVWFIVSLCVLAMWHSRVTAQEADEQLPDTIPFELNAHHNIVVDVIINATDTARLMFHTAANDVSVIESSAGRLPTIQWDEGQYDATAWGGRGAQRYSPQNTLSMAGLTWDSLGIWQNQLSGPGTDGKFGPQLFDEKYIEINYDDRRIIIHNQLPENIQTFYRLPIAYENGHMYVEVILRVGDQDVRKRCMIHSGYAGTILLDDSFASEVNLAEKMTITDRQELKDSLGNTITSKKGMLPYVRIADEVISDMVVGFFDGNQGIQRVSVLGADILRRFHLIVHADRTSLYLKPSGES